MRIKHVLCPTDFSSRAGNALEQAITFAQNLDCKLLVYHVFHRPVSGKEEEWQPTVGMAEEAVDKKFAELLKSHPKLSKVQYEFKKELGISVDNITRVANEDTVDMVIMATKGASGFGEVLGTRTAKIVKGVNKPVLVIPDHATFDNMRKVGLACDYSTDTDYEKVHFLAQIAESFTLEVDVITLNRDDKTMTRQEIAYRERILHLLKETPPSFNFTSHSHVEEGLIEYATSHEIGLIAILPKTYSFIERLFHESLTTKMAFKSPFPLLVLK